MSAGDLLMWMEIVGELAGDEPAPATQAPDAETQRVLCQLQLRRLQSWLLQQYHHEVIAAAPTRIVTVTADAKGTASGTEVQL